MKNTFSWLKNIAMIKASLSSDLNAGMTYLQQLLRAHLCCGFEIELLGKILREIDLNEITALPVCRVAVLSSFLAEPLSHAIRVALLMEGYYAEIYESPFATYRQEILSPDSELYRFLPDIIVLAIDTKDLDFLPIVSQSDEMISQQLTHIAQQWSDIWKLLAQSLDVPVLQHLYSVPEEDFLGIAERKVHWSSTYFIEELNQKLIEQAPSFVRWIDIERLAARVGRQNWYDMRLYYHGKYGFSVEFLPEYSQVLLAGFRHIIGKTKKALIVDLDNTLWGGIIGDDGVDGILFGQNSAAGEAFLAFCHYLKQLAARGVILGICSKNELAIAKQAFEHLEMPLRLDDFAAIRCNWQDKASNLLAIADEINIDIAALVFIDDNPAECELVRQKLPEVQVIELNEDPSLFIRKLDKLHLFETANYSQEDINRTSSYRAKNAALMLRHDSANIENYLLSLQMVARIAEAMQSEMTRIAQMELKTNQFNLSTRRRTFEQLQESLHAPNKKILAIYLTDRFTEHGLVSYIAMDIQDKSIIITDWIMSCRVFSRTLEAFVMNHVLQMAMDQGINDIQAYYNPTSKNKLMIEIFEKMGFNCREKPATAPWIFHLSISPKRVACFIKEENDEAVSSI